MDHIILLNRLDKVFGIKGKALTWFRSYLTERTQYVQVDYDSSNYHKLSCGVPQGSVLGPILYLLYTAPLADIIKHHNLCYHFYADNNQIYMTFKPLINETAPEDPKSIIEACLKDINYWMDINKLKLNNGKTELLVIQSPHRPLPPLQNINCRTEMIKSTKSAKNIGVWFDNIMSMSKQVNAICKKAFYHLRNIASIRRFLSQQHCEILIRAFVTSALDCCNSLLYGLPQYEIKKVQYVQNAAARLLTCTGKYEHITPILKELHWIPVYQRIEFKILVLTFKALNGTVPKYLHDLLILYEPNRTLRSIDKKFLAVPSYNLERYGRRAFSVAAPILWNGLPDKLRNITCIDTFKKELKTFLFRRTYI